MYIRRNAADSSSAESLIRIRSIELPAELERWAAEGRGGDLHPETVGTRKICHYFLGSAP